MVNLNGAKLGKANLNGAKLGKANHEGADLSRANLGGASLPDATLIEANLNRANLNRADLRGADLRDANLEEADLRGADLGAANLEGAKRSGCRTDERTVWPDGLCNADREYKLAVLQREAKEKAVKEAEKTARNLARDRNRNELARWKAEKTAQYMSVNPLDNRDGVSSSGDPDSMPDHTEICPGCELRVEADDSCLC